MSRKKFKIMYPKDYHDPDKAGKQYKPSGKSMVVMNSSGIFFLFSGDGYYCYMRKLSEVLDKYNVVWEG